MYCGSSNHVDSQYLDIAEQLGYKLANHNIELVYGGGNVGMMKKVADGVLAAGGEVTGVITEHLKQLELAHTGIQTLHITESMHQRKFLMAQLSDAFIALPGGFGTLEELAEAATWTQINIHSKPVGVLNVNGFFDGLHQWIEHSSKHGFIRPAHRNLIHFATSFEALLQSFHSTQYSPLAQSL